MFGAFKVWVGTLVREGAGKQDNIQEHQAPFPSVYIFFDEALVKDVGLLLYCIIRVETCWVLICHSGNFQGVLLHWKKKKIGLIASHHGQSECCLKGFKAASQSKYAANKTSSTPSQTIWLVNILHNLRPGCLLIKLSRFHFYCHSPLFVLTMSVQLSKVVKLKTMVVKKYATFSRDAFHWDVLASVC